MKQALAWMMLFTGTALYVNGQTAVASCTDLNDDDKPETALAYLNQDFQLLDSCIQKAVQIIERYRYQPAIPTLIKLIDFRKPEPPGAPHMVLHPSPTIGFYPAADALSAMWVAALPAIKALLSASAGVNTIKQVNAAEVLFAIEPSKPDAIRAIIHAGKSSSEAKTSKELYQIATKLTRYCRTEEVQDCKEALNDK